MKNTATIYDYLKTELINSGYNEMFEKNRMTVTDPKKSIIRKILTFDEEVYNIVTENLFNYEKLENIEHDKEFKKMFTNKFMRREIDFQTIETFSSVLTSVFIEKKSLLEVYYNNIEEFLKGSTKLNQSNKGNSQSDKRYLSSDLPQTEINLNVDDTILDYGNLNTISRDKSITDQTNQSQTDSFNPETLSKMEQLITQIMLDFEKRCFLKVW